MRNLRWLLPALIGALLTTTGAQAQTSEIEKGRALYRSNCAFCHGLTGLGGRGPDLVTGQRPPDNEIKKIIENGVPGSTMPAFGSFEETELTQLVNFIKHLSNSSTSTQKATGEPGKGKAVYAKAGCAGCHQIGFTGSTYGPDLTRIGSARSVHYLQESIVQPSGDIPQLYEGRTVTTKDGKKVTGVRINEDQFSIQLRLPSEQFTSFIKSDVQQVVESDKSLMPAYASMPKPDLDNLVAYLATLKGNTGAGRDTKKAEGIR